MSGLAISAVRRGVFAVSVIPFGECAAWVWSHDEGDLGLFVRDGCGWRVSMVVAVRLGERQRRVLGMSTWTKRYA